MYLFSFYYPHNLFFGAVALRKVQQLQNDYCGPEGYGIL